jgi:hypothetical protein
LLSFVSFGLLAIGSQVMNIIKGKKLKFEAIQDISRNKAAFSVQITCVVAAMWHSMQRL